MNGIRNYLFSAVFTEFLILLKVCVTLQYKVTKTWPECCRLCPGVFCWPLNFIQHYSPLSSRHCTLVAIDSEWVILIVAFLWLIMNIHWSPVLTRFTALFWLLMAGARWNSCHLNAFCVHHAPCHVTSCICRLPPALLAECLGMFFSQLPKGGQGWLISPVWNLRAVISVPFPKSQIDKISFLVLLPSPHALSVF